ncbi:MAG: flagellar motor protein MotB [Chloroflexota bacterium]
MRWNKRVKSDEETSGEPSSDRYLITYADLITLLLGLFVILYATSQIDNEKFKAFSSAFSEYFKAKDSKTLQGGDGVLQGHKKGVPLATLAPLTIKSPAEVESKLSKSLAKEIAQGGIKITFAGNEMILSVQEKLLFESGKAELSADAYRIIDILAASLRGSDLKISVDGHTDSAPIRSFQFESNWHLSVARATNVAYGLVRAGAPEDNLSIRGFAATRPVAPNSSEAGRALNRRVEVVIAPASQDSPATAKKNN